MAGKEILIVEDNPLNLELAKDILQSEGYEVSVATSGLEALERIKVSKPDLVIMDIQLPSLDGLTVTKILKSDPVTRDIPVIALTAYAMKGDEEKMKEAGCCDYVPKPLEVKRFISVVAKHVQVESKL